MIVPAHPTVDGAACATPSDPIAYLVPEFPGQTHIFIWREIVHLREWGADVRLFATRPPGRESSARHSFADEARRETVYLWPRPLRSALGALAWAALTRPFGLARAAATVLTLDGVGFVERARMVPLIALACVCAREASALRVRHLHLHSAARSAVIALMARHIAGLTYSIALNAHIDWWGGGMSSKLLNAEFVLVNAEWLRDQVHATVPDLRESRVLIARPGVDTRKWVPRSMVRDGSSFELVTVARIHHGKGHDISMRAVARLRGSGRDVRLRIVGGGPALTELQSLARELSVEDAIEFTGSASEEQVMTFLRAADAFVLPSRFEALGVVYMEAMAVALPTIGADVGGVAEVITDGHDGLLVPPEDDASLAAAIVRLMDNPELRVRLGMNARRTVVERFDSRIGAAVLYERLFGFPPSAQTKVEITG